MSRTTTT